MPQESDLFLAIKRLVAEIATEDECSAVREALMSGRLAMATGDRAVAIGGDATDAIIITGDGNVVHAFRDLEAAALKLALDRLYPRRLRQLPADLVDFTGREEEVEKLLSVFRGRQGQAAISALVGMGGVGKTTLAVHVAHRIAPEYPDAQIVVDLMGTAESSLSPVAAMGYVVRAFHPEARLPEGPGEMEPLYRSVLSGKKAFLLLDNARDAAQVRPLLPPAPCGVIITSRPTIVLPGVQHLSLDVLPGGKAVELLTTILGPGQAAPEEMLDLAEKCGYLPLALRVAGGFLVGHPDWTVDDYLMALANEKELLRRLKYDADDVEATLGLSAAQLAREKPGLAAQWQMLAVFPASFDRKAAAAVWGVQKNEAMESLSELLARSQVFFDPEKQRYRLHDLMRPVAENAFGYGGKDTDREGEQKRLVHATFLHAAHYAEVLHAAEGLYLKGGHSILLGLDLFDTEWDNILAGQAWVAEHSYEREVAAPLCSYFPDAGPYILNLRLHPHEWIAWLTEALAAARHLNDRAAECRHLGNLGVAYTALSEPRRAIEFNKQALAVAREIGNRKGEGAALGNLGTAYRHLGEFQQAIEFYEQRLVIAREQNDRRGIETALGNMGNLYINLREYRRAIEFYERALLISRELDDLREEGSTLCNLGNAYHLLGETNQAIEFYKRFLSIAREIGDRRGEGNVLCNLGSAYFVLNDPNQTITFCDQALPILREIGDRRGEGVTLWNLSGALYKLGERDRAISCAEEALNIYREIEDPRTEEVFRQLEKWRQEA